MRPTPLLAAIGLAAASPVWAEQPRLRPSRDVDVVYQAATQGRPVEQRVRWLAAAQTMRIDPPGNGLHVIIDYAARRMSVVRDATRSVVDMLAPDGAADVLGGTVSAGSYARQGQATVAGLPCTEWQTQGRNVRATSVCITEDGVLLRVGMAGQTLVSAVTVQYGPQDPAAFRVPSDYVHRSPGAAR